MRPFPASLPKTLLPFALLAVSAHAQQTPATVTPRLDLALGYNHVQANAPPGVSNDFGLQGGFATLDFHLKPWLAATAEVTGGHANNISSLGQNLTLITYLGGPRVQFSHHRLVPFAQALFGAARGMDSYFPNGNTYTTGAINFAYSAGGGLDINLTHRIAVRPLEVQYLYTTFNNGSSNNQHHLMTGAGIVFKFGGREPAPKALPAPPPPVITRPRGDIHFSCMLNTMQAAPGDTLHILGETSTEPDHLTVMYTWMPDAGMIQGSGRDVSLDTTGMAPGHHVIRGHAAVVGDYALAADCALPYDLVAPPAPVPPPPPPPTPAAEQEFHTNVPDAYFDYNKSTLRPDAEAATRHAADYLNSHPAMRVRVEGFADERGSVEYNLMLGQQRAESARNALIAAGVDAARVEIVSFGKAMPVCTDKDEACYRQNRRAAFSLHP